MTIREIHNEIASHAIHNQLVLVEFRKVPEFVLCNLVSHTELAASPKFGRSSQHDGCNVQTGAFGVFHIRIIVGF